MAVADPLGGARGRVGRRAMLGAQGGAWVGQALAVDTDDPFLDAQVVPRARGARLPCDVQARPAVPRTRLVAGMGGLPTPGSRLGRPSSRARSARPDEATTSATVVAICGEVAATVGAVGRAEETVGLPSARGPKMRQVVAAVGAGDGRVGDARDAPAEGLDQLRAAAQEASGGVR